jgi:hypothetical protein
MREEHTMWKRKFWKASVLLHCVLAAAALTAGRTMATDFTWDFDGCGQFGCLWGVASNWSPSGGPPGAGDKAIIDKDEGVNLLPGTTGPLIGVDLGSGASLSTAGHSLDVTGGTNGTTSVVGTGSLGNNNTRLLVPPGPAPFEFVTEFMNVRNGGELSLRGGTAVAEFRMVISKLSLISGRGLIFIDRDESGDGLSLNGTLRPEGGDFGIQTNRFKLGTLDLDGNIAGEEPGRLDVTDDGDLLIRGPLEDSFSGQINIGNGNTVDFDRALDFDGQLNFTTTGINRLVAPMFSFVSGAQVTTSQSAGRIEGESVWSDGSSLNLTNAVDVVSLSGDSVIESGVSFSGDGRITNVAGSTMSLLDGATVGVRLLNQGTLEVGNSAGEVTVGDFDQAASGALKIELGGMGAGEFDSVHVLDDGQFAGNLDVTLLGGFTLEEHQNFKILDVDGDASGQFAGLAEGAAIGTPGETLFISYAGGDGNDVVLYTDPLAGDFSFDGDVDGFDFLKWQRGGSPNPLSQSDLSVWQANFGNVSPLSATFIAVPEPATAIMLMLGMTALHTGRRTFASTLVR